MDSQRLAGAKLGDGAVLRILDSRTIVPPLIVDRIVAIARDAKIPLQLGTTSGGTDAGAFSAGGAIDVGLSWPGRYSHSPVEIMDHRDLEALVRLIAPSRSITDRGIGLGLDYSTGRSGIFGSKSSP